jgi:hypothetical protein
MIRASRIVNVPWLVETIPPPSKAPRNTLENSSILALVLALALVRVCVCALRAHHLSLPHTIRHPSA